MTAAFPTVRRRVRVSSPHRLCVVAVLVHCLEQAEAFFPEDTELSSDPSAFIFGGDDTKGERYPYLASLRSPATGEHFCGGALVSPTIVLTAAHCLEERLGGFKKPDVHFGRTCTNCNDEKVTKSAKTRQSVIEPGWTGSLDNGRDLALLILDRPINPPYLKILPLEDPNVDRFDFEFLSFAGYGLVGEWQMSQKLQEVEIPYRSKAFCDTLYKLANYRQLPYKDTICAGGLGKELCKGDSGGPLLVKGETFEDDYAIGVLSGGSPGCGIEVEIPAIFTNLYMYSIPLQLYIPKQYWKKEADTPPTPTPAPMRPPPSAETDKRILLTFKNERKFQIYLWSWLPDNDMCSDWTGVKCSDDRVVFVQLPRAGITGPLPGDFSGLDKLEQLTLQMNQFTGTLPEAWSSLTALKYLDVSVSKLAGALPRSWSNLSNLGYLAVYDNSLTGELPQEWGAMANMNLMFLQNNRLVGGIPSSWSAFTPRAVKMEKNSITGDRPSTWLATSFSI